MTIYMTEFENDLESSCQIFPLLTKKKNLQQLQVAMGKLQQTRCRSWSF